MELTLTVEEQEFLNRLLEQRHREILKEISHRDNREFRQVLRKNEETIEGILNQLRGAPVESLRA
jgi:AAA+ ATPase superfamily predicted ATPase